MKKKPTDETLEKYYSTMLSALKENGLKLYADEMEAVTCLSKGQIGKALQWARRRFDGKQLSIKDLILSSPTGYFLPTCKEQLVAYCVWWYMDTQSRTRTGIPTFNYAMKYYGKEITDAIKSRNAEEGQSECEMVPWAVFNNLI